MSNTQNEQKANISYPIFEMKNMSAPLILKRDVINKMRYLCETSPKNEWSGTLITRKEGSIGSDNANFIIVAEDLYPMDIGKGMNTSYEYGSDIVEFYEAKPHLEQGHESCQVHSHCESSVFFSSTDDNHVMEGAVGSNYFVSLITNNKGDVKAKLAVETSISIGDTEQKVIATMEMNVMAEDSEVDDDIFINRVADLVAEKKKEEEEKKNQTSHYPYGGHPYDYDYGYHSRTTVYPTGGKHHQRNPNNPKWWDDIMERLP